MEYHARPQPAPRSLSSRRRPTTARTVDEEGGSPADSGVSSGGGPARSTTSSLGTMQRDFDPNLYTYDHAARDRRGNARGSTAAAPGDVGETVIGKQTFIELRRGYQLYS